MPLSAPRPCRVVMCGGKTRDRNGLCEKHQDRARKPWQREGSGRGGSRWRKIRAQILHRDGYLCQPCRREHAVTEATVVDHIVPLAEGGTDDPGNLQSICADHDREKTKQESIRGARRSHGKPLR